MAKRLLIVEDEPAVARGLRDAFEFQEYSVEVAEDGEEALRKAREGTFDAIILDIMLPLLSGFEVAGVRGLQHRHRLERRLSRPIDVGGARHASPRLGETSLTFRIASSSFQALFLGRGPSRSLQPPSSGVLPFRWWLRQPCEAVWLLSMAGSHYLVSPPLLFLSVNQ